MVSAIGVASVKNVIQSDLLSASNTDRTFGPTQLRISCAAPALPQGVTIAAGLCLRTNPAGAHAPKAID
jgi:hypothetical protein